MNKTSTKIKLSDLATGEKFYLRGGFYVRSDKQVTTRDYSYKTHSEIDVPSIRCHTIINDRGDIGALTRDFALTQSVRLVEVSK